MEFFNRIAGKQTLTNDRLILKADVRARKKGVLATHNEHENTRKNQIGTQEVNVILYNLRSLNPG